MPGVSDASICSNSALASRITFFAPVGLLFFFSVVAIFAAAQRREIHPLNYLFFGCAFFAYHLLFSYLVDHLDIAHPELFERHDEACRQDRVGHGKAP